jgi:hypothetical protein
MSTFNKTEYHNNNPEQGISAMQDVRDGKSHSNTYLKQADKRNQIHTVPVLVETMRHLKTNRVATSRDLQTDMAETMDGEADAFADLETVYDVEGDEEAYEAEMARRELVKRLREVEKDVQDAKQEKQQMRLIEKTGKTDVERGLKKINTDAFEAFVLAMEKAREDDEEEEEDDDGVDNFISDIENLTPRFESYQRHLIALDEYKRFTTQCDPEYERLLQYKILSYNMGNHTGVVDVKLCDRDVVHNLGRARDQDDYDQDDDQTGDYFGTIDLSQYYDTEEEMNKLMAGGVASEEDMEEYYREQRERMEDAGERLQDEVENRGEDAMDNY